MLSYRHAFHAGNHADVLKHYVLSLVLDYFNQKAASYWYVDTHAGAGMYALNGEFAQKNAEFETGISRLLHAESLPQTLADYVALTQQHNQNSRLTFYPGSPKIADSLIRATDKMRLFELHPNDYTLLLQNFSNENGKLDAAVKIAQQDGFAGIKACLPPPTKRAAVLIDPPYELKEDYQRVVNCIQDNLKRFATGTYMVWYPLLQRPEPVQMLENLQKLNLKSWLNIQLSVQSPSPKGFGMHGSGMFIVNPPYTLPATLKNAMPTLVDLLSLDDSAHYSVTSHIT